MASNEKIATGRLAIQDATELNLLYKDAPPDIISFKDVIAVVPVKNSASIAKFEVLFIAQGFAEDAGKLRSVLVDSVPRDFLDKFLLASIPSYLTTKSSDGASSLHVVISSLSGAQQADSFFENVVQPLLTVIGLERHDYEVHKTTTDRSIVDYTSKVLLSRANAGKEQTVLLLSGDGGIVDLIDTLLQSPQSEDFVKPTIGIIVSGTGNALANSSGLNDDETRGLGSILRGTPKNLPTFKASFSPGAKFLVDEARRTEALPNDTSQAGIVYGAVVCSWALHASLVADSDTSEYRKYGSERFHMAAKDLLSPSDGSQSHTYHGQVSIYKKSAAGDEIKMELDRKEHMYILVTLVSNLERTFRISPHSTPLDGQLRLLHFGTLPSHEVMKILGLAYTGGQHIQEAAVGYDDIEGLRIQFDEPDERWRRVCIDGKIIRVGPGGWMEVRREMRQVANLIAANRQLSD